VLSPDSFLLFDAVALAIVAAVVDVRERRIPNWLTYSGILLAVALRFLYFRWNGLASAIAGTIVAGGIMLVFYVVRAMGAGDVKLMAAIGSLVGPSQAITVLLATAIFGGVLAFAYAIYRKRAGSILRNVASVLRFHSWGGLHVHPEINLDNPSALRMPYGLAIAAGTLYPFVAMCWR
jgi:prepilin peptidase CpaA